MAASPRIIVIGGGLAGLSAVDQNRRGRRQRWTCFPSSRSSGRTACARRAASTRPKTSKAKATPAGSTLTTPSTAATSSPTRPRSRPCAKRRPAIIDLLDRMGVPFNRTPEGLLDFRRFGGTLYNRTAFAGATTGQQLLYALDEQVRRHESEGKVRKYEGWEFLSAIIDSKGVCRGIVAMDLRTMEVRAFAGEAIILATGGNGAIFGKSTNSVVCTGSAQSAVFQQGVYYANGEFIQVHPTCIPGEDKLRLMSESARGEGGRVWVPKKGRRQAPGPRDSRSRALVFPRRVVSQVRQPGASRRGHPRHSQSGLRERPRHRRPAHGLSRPHSHRSRHSRSQARRHPGDL